MRLGLGLLAVVVSTPAELAAWGGAQDPPPVLPVPSPPDTAVRLRPPVLPTSAHEVPSGPLPPGTRYTFTRDSVRWTGAQTLADLLGNIPGVYVARGGFLGQPEYVLYAGRGAAGVEVYWDGLRFEPLGGDSLYLDMGRISLTYLRRVDVEVLPAVLRVYLVSERHELGSARSLVRIMSGSFSTAQYTGLYQRKWPSGIGLNLAGDFVASDGAPGVSRNDQTLDLWAAVEWVPDPSTGASYQMRRQNFERDPPVETTGVPARKGTRTDFLFRLFKGGSEGDPGWRFDAGLGSSSWTGDSTLSDQNVRQAFGRLRYAGSHWSVEGAGRIGDARFRHGVEARAGWMPWRGVVVSGHWQWNRHDDERISRLVTAQAALYRGPFAIVGQMSGGRVVQAPVLPLDSAQDVDDASVAFRLTTRRLSGSVGLVRRSAFLPMAMPDFPVIPAFDTSRAATYVVATATLQITRPLALRGWYSNPRTDPAGLQPPTHGRAELELRSNYYRTFRSGAFDLVIRYGLESWSRGTAGIGSDGAPILLPGATFHDWLIKFRLVDFVAFWNLRNARNSRAQYVPGLTYPRNAQTFGVTWEFAN